MPALHCAMIVIAAMIAGLGSLRAESAARTTPSDFHAFDTHLRQFRDWLRIPGIAAVIVADGRVVWRRNLGYADLEHKIPVTDATRFWIASLTKTMSATVVMQLAEAGTIDLTDPVAEYLPDSGLPPNILVSHLLSHTSNGVPGQNFAYSSGRFGLLSSVVEASSGEPFADALDRRIFAPLHMKRTLVNLAQPGGRRIANLARPYEIVAARRMRPDPLPRPGLNAAAGVISTTTDLAKYAAALDDPSFLSTGIKAEMFTPQVSIDGETLPYGLGWFVQDVAGERLVWHYGEGRGYSSLLLKVPARRLTLIVLANSPAMSAAFPLVSGDIGNSTIAVDFLRDVVCAGEDPRDARAIELSRDATADRMLGERYLQQGK